MPSNATETIDARILRLIGLEDIFDLDYDTYITLLKEAMVKGRMSKTTIPSEEVELLTDEWKRVKTKKDSGRFKVKKKKITATALKTGGGGILTGKKTSIPEAKLLPMTASEQRKEETQEQGKGGFNIGEIFTKISESVTSIAKTLREKNKLSKKESAFDRKAEENEKRKLQKENLKKRFSKMASVAQKILQPVQSLLDKLINYFTMIFLGRAVIKLIDWFSDKKNKDKISTIVRFVEDWWPLLLGGYLLFGTGLGSLIVWLVPAVAAWSLRLARLLIKHPILAAALAGTLITQKLLDDSQGASERLIKEEEDKRGKKLTKKEQTDLLTKQASNPLTGGMLIPTLVQQQLDKPVDKPSGKIFGLIPSPKPGNVGSYNRGGNVYDPDDDIDNIVDGPGGKDKVPSWLTAGETVMEVGGRERQIAMTGVDPLWFNTGPNANKPQMKKSWMMAGGGLVPGYSNGGVVGNRSPLISHPNARLIFDKLVRGGISRTGAAGMVANIGVETDYTYNPGIQQYGGGPGRGLAQWEMGGRFDTDPINLVDFAKNRGTSWDNLDTQVNFIIHEMKSHSPRHLLQISEINRSKNVRDATNLFLTRYEKAGVPHTNQRLKVALAIEKANWIKPPGPKIVGSKNLHTSMSDDEGLSRFIPKAIRGMIPKFHSGGMIPKQSGSNMKVPSPPSRTPVVVNTIPVSMDNIDTEISNPSVPTLPLMDVAPYHSYKDAILGIG